MCKFFCALFLLSAYAFGQTVTWDFAAAHNSGLTLTSASSPAFEAALAPIRGNPKSDLAGLLPFRSYALVLQNTTPRPIAMVAITWTNAEGKLAGTFVYNLRRNFVEPILQTGASLLLFPSTAIGGFGADLSQVHGKLPSNFAGQMTGHLDAILWSDGQITGPDTAGIRVRLGAERRAMLDLADDLHGIAARGQDSREHLANLAGMRPEPTTSDPAHDEAFHYSRMRRALAEAIGKIADVRTQELMVRALAQKGGVQ